MKRGSLITPVVGTEWLAAHLRDSDLLVLDVSVGLADDGPQHVSMQEVYASEHIPGAAYGDIVNELSELDSPFDITRPTIDRATAVFGQLGIGSETKVVAYDSVTGACAARLWWLLKSFGHDQVAMLDGGLQKWKSEGRPIEGGTTTPTPTIFVAHERPAMWADKEQVSQVVREGKPGTLVNAISHPSSDLIGLPADVVKLLTSTIPGSVSLPYSGLLEPGTATFRPDTELKDELKIVPSGEHTIVYCGSALGASMVALALTAVGRTDVAVYDGSLAEWLADPDAPIETNQPF
ncbi:MAG: sulfurtransferase [Terriglobales bacterium]